MSLSWLDDDFWWLFCGLHPKAMPHCANPPGIVGCGTLMVKGIPMSNI
ncbi:MAG: hypothetical protein Q6366_003820 [Candidatus Freyarchaeota archaeon]